MCSCTSSASLDMAKKIVLNAKMRRTGVCGAAETLLVDRGCADTQLKPLVEMLIEAGCEVRGDAATVAVDKRVKSATEEDWGTEYLDAIIAVKVVDDIAAAIAHIEQYGSHHTDAIVAADEATPPPPCSFATSIRRSCYTMRRRSSRTAANLVLAQRSELPPAACTRADLLESTS